MKKSTIILFIILSLLVFSCSTVNLVTRKEKDTQLNSADYLKLKGTYSNITIDQNYPDRTLFRNFRNDTLGKQKQYAVDIIPIDPKTLTLSLNNNGVLVKTLTLKGKYEKGYFKVKRNYRTKFIAGPLLWVFGEHLNYIGLTKENNLVVLESGGAGVLLLVVIPFFVAGGDKHDYEYRRIK